MSELSLTQELKAEIRQLESENEILRGALENIQGWGQGYINKYGYKNNIVVSTMTDVADKALEGEWKV